MTRSVTPRCAAIRRRRARAQGWGQRGALARRRDACRARAFRDRSPSSDRGRGECRVAGRNPWPACNKESRRQSPQVQPASGIPRAVVLTFIRDLPGVRLDSHRRPRGSSFPENLAPASGRQDHAISRPRPAVRPRTSARCNRPAATAPRTQRP